MGNIADFCTAVLREIPRATAGERRSICTELTDHMQDHRDALVERGVEESEAERRAVAAMGDPAEIGRAWNAILSPFWLWFGRGCMALFLLIALLHLGGVQWRLETIFGAAMIARAEEVDIAVDEIEGFDLFWQTDPEVKLDLGGHIVRIHRVALWENDGEYRMQLYSVTYPKDPTHFPLTSNVLMFGLEAADVTPTGGSGADDVRQGYTESRYTYRIGKGKPYVDVSLDYNGKQAQARVPLEWGGAS